MTRDGGYFVIWGRRGPFHYLWCTLDASKHVLCNHLIRIWRVKFKNNFSPQQKVGSTIFFFKPTLEICCKDALNLLFWNLCNDLDFYTGYTPCGPKSRNLNLRCPALDQSGSICVEIWPKSAKRRLKTRLSTKCGQIRRGKQQQTSYCLWWRCASPASAALLYSDWAQTSGNW